MNTELRTTTLVAGPFTKPLGPELGSLLGRFMARAISQGYAVAKLETEQSITVTAVMTEPVRPIHMRARAVAGA
jgi:hypothetical protein